MTILYYLLNSLCIIIFKNPGINLLSSLIGLALMTIPGKDKIIKKLFFIILVTSTGLVWDILIYALINKPDSLNTVGIITNVSLFVVEIFFETIFFHPYNNEMKKKEGIVRPLHIRKWKGRGRLFNKSRYRHLWLYRFCSFKRFCFKRFWIISSYSSADGAVMIPTPL